MLLSIPKVHLLFSTEIVAFTKNWLHWLSLNEELVINILFLLSHVTQAKRRRLSSMLKFFFFVF